MNHRRSTYIILPIFCLFSMHSFSQMSCDAISANRIKSKTAYLSDKPSEKGRKHYLETYDKHGNPISFTFYNVKGELEKKTEKCHYDSDHNLLQRTEFDSTGAVESEFGYTYKKGLLVKETEVQKESGKTIYTATTIYIYDKKQRLIKEEYEKTGTRDALSNEKSSVIYIPSKKGLYERILYLNADRSIGSQIVYETDEFGNDVAMNRYIPLKSTTDTALSGFRCNGRVEAKRDSKSRESELISYDTNMKLDFRKVTFYDAKGNCAGLIWYDADGKITERSSSTYDDKGKEISAEQHKTGEKSSYLSFDYSYYEK